MHVHNSQEKGVQKKKEMIGELHKTKLGCK